MAGLNGNDIVEFRLEGRLFNQKTLSIFHYRVQTDSGEPTYALAIQPAAEGFDAGTNNPTLAMLAAQTPQYRLLGVWAQRIYPTRDRAYFAPSDLPGTYDGTCLSPNQAASIEKWAWLGGRHGVGALHLPGVPSEAQSQGMWTPAYVAILANIVPRLKIAYSPPLDPTCIMVPVILNKANKSTSQEIGGATVKTTVRVMRRRTIGVGE